MPILDLPSAHCDPDAVAALGREEIARGDLLYILGVMCAPHAPEKAIALCEGTAIDELITRIGTALGVGIDPDIPSSIAYKLPGHVSPKEKLWAELTTDSLAFVASGYILRWIVSRWDNESTRAEATLNCAAGKIVDWLKANKLFRGASRDTVQRYWRDYQSVSHFWAAWELVGLAGIDHATPDGFRLFLSTAHWLLHRGAEIVPVRRRAGEAILSRAVAWQMPGDFVPSSVVWTKDLDAHDIRKAPLPQTFKATSAKRRR